MYVANAYVMMLTQLEIGEIFMEILVNVMNATARQPMIDIQMISVQVKEIIQGLNVISMEDLICFTVETLIIQSPNNNIYCYNPIYATIINLCPDFQIQIDKS